MIFSILILLLMSLFQIIGHTAKIIDIIKTGYTYRSSWGAACTCCLSLSCAFTIFAVFHSLLLTSVIYYTTNKSERQQACEDESGGCAQLRYFIISNIRPLLQKCCLLQLQYRQNTTNSITHTENINALSQPNVCKIKQSTFLSGLLAWTKHDLTPLNRIFTLY